MPRCRSTLVLALLLSSSCISPTSLTRASESVLRNNLFTLRTAIDEYTFDKQQPPQSLQDLVDAGYLRELPLDPVTRSTETWRQLMKGSPGIVDISSGSDARSLEGTVYSEW